MQDMTEHLRAHYQNVIDAARRQFEETGNPLFAWEAYGHCRISGLPIPEWVFLYFDKTSKRLGVLVEKSRAGTLPREHPAETLAAFGIDVQGRGSVFARFADRWLGNWEWLGLGEQVATLYRKGMPLKAAIPAVAESHAMEYRISADRKPILLIKDPNPPTENEVREAWRRYKAEYPDQCSRQPRKKK